MKNEIERLPETVDTAYERILNRVDGPSRSQAKNILHIIVATTTPPLTLRELNIAVRIKDMLDDGTPPPESVEYPDLDDEGPFEELVKNRCGLLVTVVNNTVYLLNQTVKEFLVWKDDSGTFKTLTRQKWFWRHSLLAHESNFVLARVCTTYLLFTMFKPKPMISGDDRNMVEEPSNRHRNTIECQYSKDFSILPYAALNWLRTSHVVLLRDKKKC
jgi:hypothetical protein